MVASVQFAWFTPYESVLDCQTQISEPIVVQSIKGVP
jgi:hypothetical protein